MSISVAELLAELGGVARYRALETVVDRERIRAAVAVGDITRVGRGRYALPGIDHARRIAAELDGALSLTSAALAHRWGVKTLPDKPHVALPRGRKSRGREGLAHLHWVDLASGDVEDGVTTRPVTLLHCLRTLPADEALAVADSALRESGCHQLLARVADGARGRGAARVRSIAARATHLAANPFESVARDICDGVAGLDVEPQVTVSNGVFSARADLVDTRLRIIVEADSFEWHGSRSALASDCRRYNAMVVDGWLVLRFSYEDVMFHPDEVRQTLIEAVALAEMRIHLGARSGDAA